MKPLVYLSTPYTKGNVNLNVNFHLDVFNQLMDTGKVLVYPPLWTHFTDAFYPRKYEHWMDLDLRIISKCDALLRLPAVFNKRGITYEQWESAGADQECEFAQDFNIPVFFNIERLLMWADEFTLSTK